MLLYVHNTAALAAISEAARHMNSRITDLVGHYSVQWSIKGNHVLLVCILACRYDSGKPSAGDENSTKICWKGQSGCTWQGNCVELNYTFAHAVFPLIKVDIAYDYTPISEIHR